MSLTSFRSFGFDHINRLYISIINLIKIQREIEEQEKVEYFLRTNIYIYISGMNRSSNEK